MSSSSSNESRLPSVAEYAVARLAALGIKHCFGVPGDFSFPICDAIEASSDLEFVVCASELGAGYAADGYARVFGTAMLCTTHAVGELSAINAVFGSKAEKLPVFHIVGAPSTRLVRSRRHVHHSLGGEDDEKLFPPLSGASCCTTTWLTPANCVYEMERVISEALEKREPAYIKIAQDLALLPIAPEPKPIQGVHVRDAKPPYSDPEQLKAACDCIAARLASCKSPIAFVSFKVSRYGAKVKTAVEQFLEGLSIPYLTTAMDKASISESNPLFMGMYKGEMSEKNVLEAVANADLVLDLGESVFDDLSTGFGTAFIPLDKVMTVAPTFVVHSKKSGDIQNRLQSYSPVFIADALNSLLSHPQVTGKVDRSFNPPSVAGPPPLPDLPSPNTKLTYQHLFNHLLRVLQPHDVLLVDTGTASLLLPKFRLPESATYQNQTLWGSIGWATPAALGASLALKTIHSPGRAILVTGDGAHQMTAPELGTMDRFGADPLIVLVNNGLHGIEEYLDRDKGHEYNVLPRWEYAELPRVFGCTGWVVAKVDTTGEFARALEQASGKRGKGGYVEAVLEDGARLVEPPSAEQLRSEYRATF